MNKWIELNRRDRIDARAAAELSRKLSDTRKQTEDFVCPSWGSHVVMRELIEKSGSFGCVNCVR